VTTRAYGPEVEDRIARIERGLQPEPALRGESVAPVALAERMERLLVPGVSVAVIDAGRMEWARGYGVREAGRPDPVTPSTLFQAASISKPVAVLAALRLVGEGRLDLDEDVNRYLTSWRVPANGGWQPRVTLRQLMCHGAGLTVHGFPGYHRDRPIPTLVQVLDGTAPANTPPVRGNAVPGTQFRYSGGGTSVMQRLLMDVTGRPFPDLMRELVLDPLGMADSSYEQPLPENRQNLAASGHRTGGGVVAGRWHVYPEQAAAGLWTPPSDLAKLALSVQRARGGKPHPFLSPELIDEMLTPQVEEHIGLGFFLEGQGAERRFGHTGGNEGFRCRLVAYSERGQGAAVMTNGDFGGLIFEELLGAIADEYGWPGYRPQGRVPAILDARVHERYVGSYQLKPGFELTVTANGGALSVHATGQDAPLELRPLSETDYFAIAVDAEIAFSTDEQGAVTGLVFKQNGRELAADRLR
jgi:CubicO group peptidase (beta-lactamase class C family)